MAINIRALFDQAEALSNRAKCNRAKVGCIIADENGHLISGGFNFGYCSGINCPALNGEVSCNTIHAEMAAIENAPLGRIDEAYYAIVTKKPCDKCNEALKKFGIKFIIYSEAI